MNDCRAKVLDYCYQNGLFAHRRRLLLAVSGGVDSMVLLDLMTQASRDGQIPPIGLCVHINHQLRGKNADRDEALVHSVAQERDLPFVAHQVNVKAHAQEHKLSLETAGHQLRRDILLGLAQQHRCDSILTAHHADDQAETLIHRLGRGTGYRGLAGIHPLRDLTDQIQLIRPLLCLRRQEILTYAQKHLLNWREDQSNNDLHFTRNLIRHQLLPTLQVQSTRDLTNSLTSLAQVVYHWQRQCHQLAQEQWPNVACLTSQGITLTCSAIAPLLPWIQFELLQRALIDLQTGLRDLTQSHYDRLLEMITSDTSDSVTLPGKVQAKREGDQLYLSIFNSGIQSPIAIQELALPGITRVGHITIKASLLNANQVNLSPKSNKVEILDVDRLTLPLQVRPRRDGDRFVPFGNRSAQKVGKFLTRAKVKSEVLIVEDQERIVWVAPVRLSQEVAITPETQQVVQLELLEEA